MNKYIFALSIFFSHTVTAITFEGSGFGEIPDGPGACGNLGDPLAISFDVTDVSEVNRLGLGIDIEHDWMGDLIVELEAPDLTRHTVWSNRCTRGRVRWR